MHYQTQRVDAIYTGVATAPTYDLYGQRSSGAFARLANGLTSFGMGSKRFITVEMPDALTDVVYIELLESVDGGSTFRVAAAPDGTPIRIDDVQNKLDRTIPLPYHVAGRTDLRIQCLNVGETVITPGDGVSISMVLKDAES